MEYILSIGDITMNGEKNIITNVKINIFEDDNKATERSDWLYNSVEIEGELSTYAREATQKIFEWSKKTKRDDVYKTVEIVVKDKGERIRKYTIPQMFCHCYTESFAESPTDKSSIGHWHLILRQQHQKEYIEKIKVEC